MLKELGRRIRTLRGDAKLQQNELAILADLSQATLSRLERGLVRPEEGTLDSVGLALGKVLEWDEEQVEKEIDTLRVLSGYLPKYGRVGHDGFPTDHDPWQTRLLEIYRRVAPERRKWLVEAVEVIALRPSIPNEPEAA